MRGVFRQQNGRDDIRLHEVGIECQGSVHYWNCVPSDDLWKFKESERIHDLGSGVDVKIYGSWGDCVHVKFGSN